MASTGGAAAVRAAEAATRAVTDGTAPLTWAAYDALVRAATGNYAHPPADLTAILAEVHITEADFADGSLRIRYPGIFKLVGADGQGGATITVNPTPDNACRPRPAQLAPGGAYGPPRSNPGGANPFFLGFFGSFVVTADSGTYGTVLDLNGCTVRQGGCFYSAQTVYGHIVLGNSPFIVGTGPDTKGFVPTFEAPRNVRITNGTLGRSSHHGIQGNAARGVLVDALVIRNFEVAGIALNGARHVTVENVRVGPTIAPAPSNAFRVLTMMDFFIPRALAAAAAAGAPMTEGGVYRALAALWERVRGGVREVQQWYEEGAPAGGLSPLGAALLDERPTPTASAAYGILAHPLGPAVNDFVHAPSCKDSGGTCSHAPAAGGAAAAATPAAPARAPPQDWLLQDVTVEGLKIAPEETLALWNRAAKTPINFLMGTLATPMTDAPPGSGPWFINTLGLLSAWLGRLYHARTGRTLAALGTTFLPETAYAKAPAWLRAPDTAPEPACLYIGPQGGQATCPGGDGPRLFPAPVPPLPPGMGPWAPQDPSWQLYSALAEGAVSVVRGADIQFHVMKGVLGLRLGGLQGGALRNVVVREVANVGPPGQAARIPGEPGGPVAYTCRADGGHPAQSSLDCYMGADARGVLLAAAQGVQAQDLEVANVTSLAGSAAGLHIDNLSRDVTVAARRVAGIVTESADLRGWTNAVTQAACTGVLVTDHSLRVQVDVARLVCLTGQAVSALRSTSAYSVALKAGGASAGPESPLAGAGDAAAL